MAMAIPDKLMMFDVMPNCRMRMNEMRIETGSVFIAAAVGH